MPTKTDLTLYPPTEAAPLIHPNLSPRTLEAWRRAGKGPRFVKVGRLVGYTAEAIREYHERQTREHTSQEGR